MNDTAVMTPTFDRTTEDLGNVVELGHVNVTVPDQSKAVAFYLMGLGLTRDPYLMAGLENMWVNVGRGQFHLPTRSKAQVVRGTTALVLPNLEALLKRLDYAKKYLEGTRFSFREAGDTIEATCPWGNRIRVHAPDPGRFGAMRVGMPYVEFDIPVGTDLAAIAKFYTEILGAIAGVDCATGRAGLPAALPGAPALAEYKAVIPRADRQPANETTLPIGGWLGMAPLTITEATHAQDLRDIRETDPLYLREGIVHTGMILRCCNWALSQNVMLPAWIHMGSSVRNLGIAHVGDTLTVRARITKNYEHKGHKWVVLDAMVVANETISVIQATHTAIYQPRQLAEAA